MDRTPDAVLPCAHAYCQRCVEAFLGFENQRRCPMCRYPLSNSKKVDETWEITEQPARESINAYLAKSSCFIQVNDLVDIKN